MSFGDRQHRYFGWLLVYTDSMGISVIDVDAAPGGSGSGKYRCECIDLVLG